MRLLLPSAVFLLMISIGMSLKPSQLGSNWARLSWAAWIRILLATFVVPSALALLLAQVFRLTLPQTAGLFMVGVAPGAPLLTRNLARKGFDMHLAASYQVWAALMVPIMIPLLVAAGGKLYNRNIWISPLMLLGQIISRQLLPLALGMLLAWITTGMSKRLQPFLNMTGNVLLTLMIALTLFKMGPILWGVSLLVPLAALLLAIGSIAAVLLLGTNGDPLIKETFAVCNANRHVGLALLIVGQYPNARRAMPEIACYAILAPLVMFTYVRLFRRKERAAAANQGNPKGVAA